MNPDDHRHGTEAGHEQHIRDGETPCAPCHRAKILAARRRTKRKQMGYVYTLPLGSLDQKLHVWRDAGATYGEIADHTGLAEARVWELINEPKDRVYARTYKTLAATTGTPLTAVGVTRRIQGLMWMGYSAIRIAEVAGCHVDTIRDATTEPREFVARKVKVGVAKAYDQLHMTPATGTTKQERAGVTRSRNTARKNGWASPMAWEDIDDQRENPTWKWRSHHRAHSDCDESVVERILGGDWDLESTPAEKSAVCARWVALGHSLNELERRTGWRAARYYKGDAA